MLDSPFDRIILISVLLEMHLYLTQKTAGRVHIFLQDLWSDVEVVACQWAGHVRRGVEHPQMRSLEAWVAQELRASCS